MVRLVDRVVIYSFHAMPRDLAYHITPSMRMKIFPWLHTSILFHGREAYHSLTFVSSVTLDLKAKIASSPKSMLSEQQDGIRARYCIFAYSTMLFNFFPAFHLTIS
jgi:hypothetical protein